MPGVTFQHVTSRIAKTLARLRVLTDTEQPEGRPRWQPAAPGGRVDPPTADPMLSLNIAALSPDGARLRLDRRTPARRDRATVPACPPSAVIAIITAIITAILTGAVVPRRPAAGRAAGTSSSATG